MRKRGTWLKRTAWLTLGLVLMCGSVSGTVWASDLSGGDTGVQAPGGEQDNGNIEENLGQNVDKTFVITDFAPLDENVRVQKLEAGQEPVLPKNLDVTAVVKEQAEEEKAPAGFGVLNTIQEVTEASRLPEEQITVTGVQWEVASTSNSNNTTTYNYVPEIPETYGKDELKVLNAVTELPVIQATMAASSAGDGSRDVTTPTNVPDISDPDDSPGDGSDGWYKGIQGLDINTQVGAKVTDTGTNIVFETEGTYVIQGTWNNPRIEEAAVGPVITLKTPGTYNIWLSNAYIEIMMNADGKRMPYTSIFSIPNSSTTVNLYTYDNTTSELKCMISNGVQVIENMGTVNIMTGKHDTNDDPTLKLSGRLNNTSSGIVTVQGGSPVELNGPVANKGNMIIEESARLGTLKFVNDGTLKISKPEDRRNKVLSTLTVTGTLENNGTIDIDQGGVYVRDQLGVTDNPGMIENDGTLTITSGEVQAEVVTDDVVENTGTISINGSLAVLTSNGVLDNSGTLKAVNSSKVNMASLNNSGSLEAGEDRDSNVTMTITGGGDSFNSNKIEIQDGSCLVRSGGTVSLINSGRLKIGDIDCLGTSANSNDITPMKDPNGEGAEFILAGLAEGMIEIPNGFGLEYTGEDQTLSVINENDYENSVVKVPEQFEVNGYPFDVKEVNIELETTWLERTVRQEESTGTKYDPGITQFDRASVNAIQNPGRYTITFVNKDNDYQHCNAGPFEMSEWSMNVRTSDGETDGDEISKEVDAARGDNIESAVCTFGDDIKVKVNVAIFQEANKTGKVSLYWEARDVDNTGDPKIIEIESKNLTLTGGKGTAEFTIKTSAGSQGTYEMTAPFNPDDLEDVMPAYEEQAGLTYGPYRLTAVYESVDGTGNHRYFDGTTPKSQHQGLVKNSDGTADDAKNLVGWYADKRLVIRRPEIDINFQPNYYTSSRVYDGTPLRLPAGEEDIQVGNREARSELKYRWYTSKSKEAVDAAYENRDPSALTELIYDADPDSAQAPTNAGYYLIEAYVTSSRTYMGYRQFRVITIDQRPAKISVKSFTKKYGADDPEEWNDILISNEMNPYYTVENSETTGILPGEEMRGIIRRVKRNETDEEREKCGNHDIEIRVEDNENYDFDYTSNVLTIEKRVLDWDNSQMFMVTTEDGNVSVVGGLNTVYHLEPDEKMEDIVENIADDDVLVSYEKLDLNGDKNKVTVDRKKLSGNDSGNYEIPTDAVSIPSGRNLKLSVKVGSIDASTVTKLQDSDFNTEDKIMDKMQAEILNAGASRGNTVLYDVILTHENGQPLSDQEIEEFPWGALTVTVPYPEGTSKSTSFVAAHMFTERISLDGPGQKPGNVETRNWNQVATVDDGVRFQITSLSPITIGWSGTTTNPGDPNNPGGSNNGGNNNDPNNPNGGSNNDPNNPNGGSNGNNNNNNNKTTSSNATSSNATSSNARTTRTSGVKTGDSAEIAFYMITTLVACLLLILIICLIRMQFRKKD